MSEVTLEGAEWMLTEFLEGETVVSRFISNKTPRPAWRQPRHCLQ
jgi:hypothetical protein